MIIYYTFEDWLYDQGYTMADISNGNYSQDEYANYCGYVGIAQSE